MTEINLNIDGKDDVKVSVINGISFEGTVTSVQTNGGQFIIRGTVTDKNAN